MRQSAVVLGGLRHGDLLPNDAFHLEPGALWRIREHTGGVGERNLITKVPLRRCD